MGAFADEGTLQGEAAKADTGQNILAKSLIATYLLVADGMESVISIILGIRYGALKDGTTALRLQ